MSTILICEECGESYFLENEFQICTGCGAAVCNNCIDTNNNCLSCKCEEEYNKSIAHLKDDLSPFEL